MRIKLEVDALLGPRSYATGSVVEIDDKRGKELVTLKHATETTDELGEPAIETETPGDEPPKPAKKK